VVPTLLLATFLVFVAVHFMPGDIIDALQSPSEIALDRESMEHTLGLDAPLMVQYARWLGVFPQRDGVLSGVLQGNFSTSWWRGDPVRDLILEALPVTIELALMAFLVTQLIFLPAGVIAALRQDKWVDHVSRSISILSISVPGFWVGTMAVVLPSLWFGYMAPLMLIPFSEDPVGNLKMFIVPAIILGMGTGGMTMRMTRTMMLEVLRQDYIRTAWAKGLREKIIVIRHALKNAFIPVVTMIGMQIPVLVGGSVIIEQIFSLPGMGRLIMNAILIRDHPLVSGTVTFFAVALVLTNLLVDLTYGYLDPRIRIE